MSELLEVTAGGLVIMSGGGAAFGVASPPLAKNGIRVSGNKLVDPSGNTLFLRGANFSGLETAGVQGYAPWYGKTVPYSTAQSWKMNAARIPMCSASFLGLECLRISAAGTGWANTTLVSADPTGTTVAATDAIIAGLQAVGVQYIVLSVCHWSAPQFTFGGVTGYMLPVNQPPHANASVDLTMLKAVVARYGTQATPQPGIDNTKIMFELVNECYLDQYYSMSTQSATVYNLMKNGGTLSSFKTNGGTPVAANWNVLGTQTMLNTVRTMGATNVLLVGGPGYSSSLSGNASFMPVDTLVPSQVALVLHPYCYYSEQSGAVLPYPTQADAYPGIAYDAGSTGSNWYLSTNAAIANDIPVLFTEDGGLYGFDNTGIEAHVTLVQNQAIASGVSAWLGWELFQEQAGDPNNPVQGNFRLITSAQQPTQNYGVVTKNWLASF